MTRTLREAVAAMKSRTFKGEGWCSAPMLDRHDVLALIDAYALIDAHQEQHDAGVAELKEFKARASWFLDSKGYRRCDIDACNCPFWHGGKLEERLDEVDEELRQAGIPWKGTILKTLQSALAAIQHTGGEAEVLQAMNEGYRS